MAGSHIKFAVVLGGLFCLSVATQAQTGAQAGAQGSAQASAQASPQQAQASGNAAGAGAASTQNGNASLASGTAFNAELNSAIDSKKCKPGDAVTARTTEAAKSSGKTVIPKGAKLMGHVTQASARANGESNSALGIVFDKAILKNGEEVPLNVAIQAVASAQSNVSAAGGDVDTMGNMGGGMASSGSAAGRGTVGAVGSTAGSTVGAVRNTAGQTGELAGNTARTAGNATGNAAGNVTAASAGTAGGLNTAGQLASNSRGVFGLNGLNLDTAASNATQGTVMTSAGKSVHLDGGTHLLLVSQAQATTTK